MPSKGAVKEDSSTQNGRDRGQETAEPARRPASKETPIGAHLEDGLADDPWLGQVARWDDAEADTRIREGLPFELAAHLQSLLDLTDEEAAHLIGRSRSTYSRYRNKNQDLRAPEAERAVRFARLLALAADTFGSLGEAKEWMLEENYALGGAKPFELAETDPGARIVRDLLWGIQHGHPV